MAPSQINVIYKFLFYFRKQGYLIILNKLFQNKQTDEYLITINVLNYKNINYSRRKAKFIICFHFLK